MHKGLMSKLHTACGPHPLMPAVARTRRMCTTSSCRVPSLLQLHTRSSMLQIVLYVVRVLSCPFLVFVLVVWFRCWTVSQRTIGNFKFKFDR
jgi:hypothetical protein